MKRVAGIFNPDAATDHGSYYPPVFEAAAHLLNVVPIIAPVHGDAEIGIDTLPTVTLLRADEVDRIVVALSFATRRSAACLLGVKPRRLLRYLYGGFRHVRT